MKHPVIAMMLYVGKFTANNMPVKMGLPEGCEGIFFAFESKKAAHAHFKIKGLRLIRYYDVLKEETK